MSFNLILFGLLTVVAIASGIVTITNKNPVVSAMALVVQFFMLAGFYLTLQAQFVAVIQILVYAGAIMVLVVFVIMLLNLGDEEKLKDPFNSRKLVAILFASVLVLQFFIIFLIKPHEIKPMSPNALAQGTVEGIGHELYTNYLFPFIAIAVLLLAAVVGAYILAKRKLD